MGANWNNFFNLNRGNNLPRFLFLIDRNNYFCLDICMARKIQKTIVTRNIENPFWAFLNRRVLHVVELPPVHFPVRLHKGAAVKAS
jgi:hypothetical protein